MKRLYITLIICLLAQLSYADGLTLTLEECRAMAVENSHVLQSKSYEVTRSEEILAAYKTNNLPNLSLGANYLYSTASYDLTMAGGLLPSFSAVDGSLSSYTFMPDTEFHAKVGSVYNVSASVMQPIYVGGKISNAIKLAKVGVSVAEQSQRLTTAEVITECDKAYFTLLKLEELTIAAEKYLAVVEEFRRQMSNAVEAGVSNKNELLKVEVKLNDAKLKQQRALNGVRLAKMNLCYTIGAPLTTFEIKLTDVSDLEMQVDPNNLDISNRPEYALLKEQITARQLEEKITQSEFLPSLTAVASYGYLNGGSLNDNALINGDSFLGGLSLNVPIFHWGEGRKKRSAAKLKSKIAESDFQDVSQKMTLELMQSINAFEESIMEVSLSSHALMSAEENMRISQNQFDQGMETTANLLEAQAIWQSSMATLVEARASQRVQYTLYLKARGGVVK